MFKKKNDINAEKIDTLIGEGTNFSGNINAKGVVRIDGQIEGSIYTEGDLIIGESGVVNAEAKGKNITIAGKINGNVECSGKLELLPTGKIDGDIEVAELFIDSGATLQGKCNMYQEKDNIKTSSKEKDKRDKEEKKPEQDDKKNKGKDNSSEKVKK